MSGTDFWEVRKAYCNLRFTELALLLMMMYSVGVTTKSKSGGFASPIEIIIQSCHFIFSLDIQLDGHLYLLCMSVLISKEPLILALINKWYQSIQLTSNYLHFPQSKSNFGNIYSYFNI